MADSKISELTALTTPASDDVLAIVDTSAGVTKKITISNLSTSSEVVDDTSPQLGGNLDLNSNNITGTGNIDVTGSATADSLTVDNITINGEEIESSAGLLLDIAGNLNIDVDGSTITLADGGVNFGQFYNNASGTFNIVSPTQDKDIVFRGNDGGSGIVALTLDISNAGAATFNSSASFGSSIDVTGDIVLGDANPTITFNDSSVSNLQHTIASGSNKLQISTDPNQVHGSSKIEFLVDATERMEITETGIDVTGTVTADGLTVDDITIDGSTISDSGDLTLDIGGDIILDAGGNEIKLKDSGTQVGFISMASEHLTLKSEISNKDMIFKGNDGGSEVTALTLDMSDAGTATFNHDIILGDNGKAYFGASLDLNVYHSGSHSYIENNTGDLILLNNSTDKDIIFQGNDGGSAITALTLDMSDGGTATFNNKVGIGTSNVKGTLTVLNSTAPTFDNDTHAGESIFIRSGGSGGSGNAQAVLAFGKADSSSLRSGSAIASVQTDSDVDKVGLGFYTSDGSASAQTLDQRMILTHTGKVGIGTTSPASELHVVGHILLNNAYELRQKDTSGNIRTITRVNNSNELEYGWSGGAVKFMGGGSYTERMRIDASSGNVGIGTTSPSSTLHIKSGGDTVFNIQGGATDANTSVVFSNSGGTERGRILYDTDDNNLQFKVNAAERMRIKSNGDIEFGSFSTDGSSTGVSFEIGGSSAPEIYSSAQGTATRVHYQFYNDNGIVGKITTNGTATSFTTSSDYRLKENVITDWDATTRLKQLKPSRFNFIADADTTVDGFLAHEVSSIVPEAISGEKDAVDSDGNAVYQGIDQSKLVPLLVKTIQELEARITTLENN